eukprot:14620-Heterococcus_DN1.PRE.4
MLYSKAKFAITAAFETARCTALEAAKCLTTSSKSLQVFSDHQCMQVLEAIDAADREGELSIVSFVVEACASFSLDASMLTARTRLQRAA